MPVPAPDFSASTAPGRKGIAHDRAFVSAVADLFFIGRRTPRPSRS